MSSDDELGRFEEASEPKDYRWQVAHIWITFTEPGFHVQPAWSCDGVLCRCVAGGGSAHGTRARTRADALCHAVLTIYCSGVVAGRRRCVSMALARHCATSLLMLIDLMGYAMLLELAHLEWLGYTSMGPRILVRRGLHCYVGCTLWRCCRLFVVWSLQEVVASLDTRLCYCHVTVTTSACRVVTTF